MKIPSFLSRKEGTYQKRAVADIASFFVNSKTKYRIIGIINKILKLSDKYAKIPLYRMIQGYILLDSREEQK